VVVAPAAATVVLVASASAVAMAMSPAVRVFFAVTARGLLALVRLVLCGGVGLWDL
jgi:hypothetical protein